MSLSTVISYDASTQFSFDATKVEVASNTLRLKDLGGATYSTTNPVTTTQEQYMLSALSSFAESASKPSNTEIKYILTLNGTDYWYSSVAGQWVASDGSYSQANTASEVNSNASTLFSALMLSGTVYLSLKVFLHTSDSSVRPTLTSNTVGYTFVNSTPSTINQTLLYGYLRGLLATPPTFDANFPAQLHVKANKAFFHGNTLIQPFVRTASFDSSGYAQLSVIETATPGVELEFSITYWEGVTRKSVKLYNAIVPNTPTQALTNFTVVQPIDFG